VTNLSGIVIALYDSNMNIFSNEQKVTAGGFLAIWYGGQITDTPLIVYLDALATDIALSTTYAFTNGESGNLDEVYIFTLCIYIYIHKGKFILICLYISICMDI
jgi:hypothetical protein